jgi:hypothetical protein
MRGWKPVGEDEIYVVLALFMLLGIAEKPKLRSYFLMNSVLVTPLFGCVILMDKFESVCKFMHSNNNDSKDTYLGSPDFSKCTQRCPI